MPSLPNSGAAPASRSGLRFFGRIFLWFWLTVLLVVAAMGMLILLLRGGFGSMQEQERFRGMARQQGQLLVQIHELADPQVTEVLQRLFGSRPIWLFDAAGKMLMQPLPPDGQPRPWSRKSSSPPFELDVEKVAPLVRACLDDGPDGAGDEAECVLGDGRWLLQPLQGNSGVRFVVVHGLMGPRNRWHGVLFSPMFTWVGLLVFLPLTGILCFLLARSLALPVHELRAISRRFAEGDLAARVPETRRDEFGDLAADFNHMAGRLAFMIDRHRRLLREVSHELRSPLARLKVAIELGRPEVAIGGAVVLARIEKEVDRLEDLIAQVLTLARLDGHDPSRPTASFDLPGLVRQIIADARFESGRDQTTLALTSVPPQPVWVVGTEDLVRRAIENVVRNALKYSPDPAPIEVSLTMSEVRLPNGVPGWCSEILVRDRGPGVAEADLGRLFEPFFRCQEDRARATGGAGLGLAIARRAVECHDGSIHAENHPDGGLVVKACVNLPAGREIVCDNPG
jgi:signal transduction histidine kinase